MATLGQYQSFAIISSVAILKQIDAVDCVRKAGGNVGDAYETLNIAKHMTNAVMEYSKQCAIPPGFDESSARRICDWLMKNLMFSIEGSIESLEETYANSLTDFSWEDYKPFDLA